MPMESITIVVAIIMEENYINFFINEMSVCMDITPLMNELNP
jgi:hypothetical protein